MKKPRIRSMNSLLKLYDKETHRDYYKAIVESHTVGQKDQIREYYFQMNLHHRHQFVTNIRMLTDNDQQAIEILQTLIK